MHNEAFQFVAQFATDQPISVIEIGSRNINGSVRSLFPNASWTGLDLHPGPDVDIVCRAEEYTPPVLVDLVVCCEVLEHAENWRELIGAAALWLKPDGRIILTCAGPGRPEHSAIDGQPRLIPGEYYDNVSADQIAEELHYAGCLIEVCEQAGDDTQAAARKQ